MPNKQISVWSLSFWIFTSLLLLATIAIPGALTLHWNIIRALFNIQYGKTEVVGQVYSGPINVPLSSFNQSAAENWAAQSGDSIDAFMLSVSYRWAERDIPSGDFWRGHPLIEWGAIAATEDAYDAAHYNVPPSRSKCPKALDIIQIAQSEHPDNGALWLAEAVVHFSNDDDDNAIAALNVAAEKPNWRSRENAAYQHLNALLQREGLPAFESASESEAATRCQQRLGRGVRDVERLMTKAVQDLEDDRFDSLLNLLYRLQQCRWDDMTYPWPIISPPDSDELLTAMTLRMNQETPSNQRETANDWRMVGRRITYDFAITFVGENAAFELMELHHIRELRLSRWRERNLGNQNGFERSWIAARACGIFALVLLALSNSLVAIEVPDFLAKDRGFIRTSPSRKASFWIVALIALAVSAMLSYRACDITLRTSSLSVEFQEQNRRHIKLLAAGLMSVVIMLFVSRWFLKPEDKKPLFAITIFVFVLYLAFVCMAANVRNGLVAKYLNCYRDVNAYAFGELDVSDIIADP